MKYLIEKIMNKSKNSWKIVLTLPTRTFNGSKAWFISLYLWIIRMPRELYKTGEKLFNNLKNLPSNTLKKLREVSKWNLNTWWKKISHFLLTRAILIALIMIVIVITIMNKRFLTERNISSIFKSSSHRLLFALGAGTIIVGKGTDLSVGRVVGFSALVGGIFSQDAMQNPYISSVTGHSPFVIILITMTVGMIFGMINGVVVTKLKVDPFIATLGMMLIAYGGSFLLTEKVSHGASISGFSNNYFDIVNKKIISIGDFYATIGMLIALCVAFFMWIIWNKTPLGRKIFAVGGNPEAAAVSGIKVGKILFITYALGGILYGLGAPLLAWSSGTVNTGTATMYELDAIAACIVGGLSFDGGRGKISGIVLGVLIFEAITNGFAMIGLPSWMVFLIKGLIIISAIAFDSIKTKKRK